ncbi:MAG: transglycosylase SLT domain-containing protein [Candidatus Latescibacteria bacterium]|nr:transglycosylase SLT domain-containing protein [Candidatus Latescibacterota bacterium]
MRKGRFWYVGVVLALLLALDELAALASSPHSSPTLPGLTAKHPSSPDSADAIRSGLAQLFKSPPKETVAGQRISGWESRLPDDALDLSVFDLPVLINERVKAEFQFLLNFKKFPEWLNRANRYVPMMREIFEKEGVPGDLVYLSLIESGYHPRAYSRRNAAGLWQFIPTTGRERGLKRTTWVDERFDPEKATLAAARHFKQLYRMFGDWQLVMAAHNGGPGLVQKVMKRKGTQDYWQMKLPKETMKFVPLIMAAAIIAKDPSRYGFSPSAEPPLAYETVSVNRSVGLETIAKGMNVPLDTLKMLNPELRKWRLPPGGYDLKIPVGTRPNLLAWLSGTASSTAAPPPASESADQTVVYIVKRGDTLWSIARRFHVTVDAIREENGLSRRGTLHPGDRLKINGSDSRQSGE